MQYKQTIKLVIDKRKLDILIRIGCPDEKLLELIKTGTFTKTGDQMIDETLECLIDFKEFDNWGGKREGAGRPKKNQIDNQNEIQVENQDENHLDNQVGNQDANQVADKDKDIGKDINNNTRGDSKGGNKNIISLGELGLVRMTQEEYNQLKDKYYSSALKQAIEKLDTWLGTTGSAQQGKDHFAYFKSNGWVWKDVEASADDIRQEEETEKVLEETYVELKDNGIDKPWKDYKQAMNKLLERYRKSKGGPRATMETMLENVDHKIIMDYIDKNC